MWAYGVIWSRIKYIQHEIDIKNFKYKHMWILIKTCILYYNKMHIHESSLK